MNTTNQKIKVWDLPTRLFHWSLVLCFAVSWGSVELFDDAMQIHFYAGYTLLTLLIFRVLWGFVGGSTARFSHFWSGVHATKAYARTLLKPRPNDNIGHNPVGGWAVIIMLTLLAAQMITGLFSNNDLLDSGPLAHYISGDLSDTISGIHGTIFNFLITIVGLHIAAVFFYRFYKHSNLIIAMITGYKTLPNTLNTSGLYFVSNFRAILVLAIAAACVAALVIYS
ncbi:cytochrome b/b6 domain-containing protein [Sulfuriferula nivalis]|uniref:Cytochrome b n=1 Tax=Sulfuriferula nivalis TaxID=2675298 RepID=A0A809RJQ9_9PROT|nr:cytochrome b/b6 domain-containing protein [Sulfuriferula nivalis]BBP01725.1 cytochrome b [Sulfuriferula nivalis]